MKKTITFFYNYEKYTAEVIKSSGSYPLIYTAYFFDETLRELFIKLTFYQESSDSEIMPSLSRSAAESELKKIVLDKVNHKKHLFEINAELL